MPQKPWLRLAVVDSAQAPSPAREWVDDAGAALTLAHVSEAEGIAGLWPRFLHRELMAG